MYSDSELLDFAEEELQRLAELLAKAEKKIVDMYSVISNGHGEAFAGQDEVVKEIREFFKGHLKGIE